MKKILKYFAIFIASILMISLLAAVYISFKGIPSYEIQAISYPVDYTKDRELRGKKLVLMLCANCHINRETGVLSGGIMHDAPPEFGNIYAPNITQDEKYGIGEWTDAELAYLLRTGIKRDGSYAPPYMAKLPHMADEDIKAIISFLRSEDRMVSPAPVPDRPVEPSFLTKLLTHVAFKPLPWPENEIMMPDTMDMVKLGKYLSHNLDCFSCHSADFKTNDFLNPEKSKGYFAGGNMPLNMSGQIIVTPNLTPDEETGIGLWTEKQFVRTLKFGIKEGEPAIQYPMMPYVQLSDREARAIYQYLRTIPPIKNKINRSITTSLEQ